MTLGIVIVKVPCFTFENRLYLVLWLMYKKCFKVLFPNLMQNSYPFLSIQMFGRDQTPYPSLQPASRPKESPYLLVAAITVSTSSHLNARPGSKHRPKKEYGGSRLETFLKRFLRRRLHQRARMQQRHEPLWLERGIGRMV